MCEIYRVLVSESFSVVSDSLRPHGLHSPWNFPGHNTGVGSLSLLQGIFPTGTEPRSLALQVDSLPAEPQGKPFIRLIIYKNDSLKREVFSERKNRSSV